MVRVRTEGGSMKVSEAREAALRKARNDAPTVVGRMLPNGAVILAIAPVWEDEYSTEYVVLAVNEGFQPFVTWRYVVGITERATSSGGHNASDYLPVTYCTYGRYFGRGIDGLQDAIRSFEERRTVNVPSDAPPNTAGVLANVLRDGDEVIVGGKRYTFNEDEVELLPGFKA
jgi:hypothetical protein